MSSTGQQQVVHSINMNEKDFEQTKKKFESVNFLAKNEAPLSLFPKLISHKERHGVIVDAAHCNRTLETSFLEHMAENLREGSKEKLNLRNFYSLLTDGSTNLAVNEKEAFLATFNPKLEGSNKVSSELNYFDRVELEAADAQDIVNTIKESFKRVRINLDKLIGFGSDGVSINKEVKEDIKTIDQRENKWLTFGWCVAYRLKLALKYAFKETTCDDIEELIIFDYLY